MGLNDVLGGFAEKPEVMDGTLEEFFAYNYCLAEDYYHAIVCEDFEVLDEAFKFSFAWHEIMRDVCRWLNYDGKIGIEFKDDIDKLDNGTIITHNNRTFIEACRARGDGWENLAKDLSEELAEKGFCLTKVRKQD